MAGRSLRPRLQDILDNIEIVGGAISSGDVASFTTDPILRLAVERAIEIISEATRHIPEEIRARYPDVPWRNIAAIGNKLRHEYQRVDPDIIWDVAEVHLPALKSVIEAILADAT
jgi:uncharacterized protein with HEPN domain